MAAPARNRRAPALVAGMRIANRVSVANIQRIHRRWHDVATASHGLTFRCSAATNTRTTNVSLGLARFSVIGRYIYERQNEQWMTPPLPRCLMMMARIDLRLEPLDHQRLRMLTTSNNVCLPETVCGKTPSGNISSSRALWAMPRVDAPWIVPYVSPALLCDHWYFDNS